MIGTTRQHTALLVMFGGLTLLIAALVPLVSAPRHTPPIRTEHGDVHPGNARNLPRRCRTDVTHRSSHICGQVAVVAQPLCLVTRAPI
jgi:hypothetical protein